MSELNRFLFEEVEMPLLEVVAAMEDTGYPVNAVYLGTLAEQLRVELASVEQKIAEIAGDKFNPGSNDQVINLLFVQLELPVRKKTPGGAPSTESEVLKAIPNAPPVVGHLLEYRRLTKLISTYCKAAGDVGPDGRLRAVFNQLGAETGRMSSGSVMQTLPKDDTTGVRKAFRASPGHRIVAADFEQQELRVLAQVSGDEGMRKALLSGLDLHGNAAVMMFKLDCAPNEVKSKYPKERDRVKALQFGLIYGQSEYAFASKLGIPAEDGKKLFDDYFRVFPGVRRFIDRVHEQLIADGYVADVFGRRRYSPVARNQPPKKKYDRMTAEEKELVGRINSAKRQAQNFVIQGASATITKLAMIRCHRAIRDRFPGVRLLLQVHDELQFEVPDGSVPTFAAALPGLMCELGLEERFGFRVPMKAEVKVGPSMGELTPWKGE